MVKFIDEIKEPQVSELGGKGYSLAVLTNNGFNVPKAFIITTKAFFEFLKYNSLTKKIEKLAFEINKDNFQEKSKEIRNLILDGEIAKDLILEIKDYLNKLNVQYVSVRSSAVSEDSLKASFAGMYDTYLNVKAELNLVLENVRKCWASLFNERAVIYRVKKGVPHLEGMAVIVQEMINAEISGITFTVHPMDEKSLLVEASYGIGDMIVSGKVEPDDYVIDRETLEIREKKIGNKSKMSISNGAEIKVIDVKDEARAMQVLSEGQIESIAKICLKVEKVFNYPQDIEWCISDNKLWMLQSRAIVKGKT